MRANAQLSLLAERLFPGSSYDALLRSDRVDGWAEDAVRRVRAEPGPGADAVDGAAWAELRQSLAETLSWMLLFRLPEDRLRVVVDSWIETQGEMLRRLARDRAEIASQFQAGARRVLSLDLDLSDRHHGGRTVAAVTLDSGLKIVYKPRDIGIEAWFANFQERLNELGAPFPFLTLRSVVREGYGWSEFAAHSRCADDDQLHRFYRNAGSLLCLLHLLRATDGHFENLIACGERQVFVDAETLFQPSLAAGDGISVLRTGMLPRFAPAAPSPAPDFGALSCVTPQSVPVPIPVSPGSEKGPGDRLETAVLTPETNVPFPAGMEAAPEAFTPETFVDEMIDGFCQTWQFAAANRDAVLEAMNGAQPGLIRYVVRDTLSYYQSIVAALCAGRLDGLALPRLTGSKAIFAPLEESEQEALRRLDIPRFNLAASDTSLGGVADCFPLSGFDLAREGLEKLTQQEMEKQAAVIRLSWGLYGAAKSLAKVVKK
jgi:lantibiotic modifying enzyme